jgi:hypothetical protein
LLRPLYRSRQVWYALRPRIGPDDIATAQNILGPQLAPLFFRMERRDQRHAIEVMRRLLDGGVNDTDLLTAALLHDCGKGPVPVWLRIAKVLSPSLVRTAGREGDRAWRGAAYRLVHHAELGARDAEQAGAPASTAALIRGQVGPDEASKLALLTAADDAS